jgi:rare lipoprotein A
VGACSTQTALPRWSSADGVVTAVPPTPVAIPLPAPISPKTVLTSYQGSGTAGRPTASGERYNPNDLTAASRNLPLGSTVKVTNAQTGQAVNVRINDRGPFVRGRSLDLSRKAAETIGITDKGVARVKVMRLSSHPVALAPGSASSISTPSLPQAD